MWALYAIAARPFGSQPVMLKLNTIQKPVLLIRGGQDVPFNGTITAYMQTQIPFSHVYVMKNAAHMVNMEQPSLFNRKVLYFFKQ